MKVWVLLMDGCGDGDTLAEIYETRDALLRDFPEAEHANSVGMFWHDYQPMIVVGEWEVKG